MTLISRVGRENSQHPHTGFVSHFNSRAKQYRLKIARVPADFGGFWAVVRDRLFCSIFPSILADYHVIDGGVRIFNLYSDTPIDITEKLQFCCEGWFEITGEYCIIFEHNAPRQIVIHQDEYGRLVFMGARTNGFEVVVEDGSGEHRIRVPPTMRTAREAVAWTYGFDDPDDYSPTIRV